MPTSPLVRVQDLEVTFGGGRAMSWRARRAVHAVAGVTFDVLPGETLALVGESGSGKTTIGRAMLRMVDATAGSIQFEGEEVLELTGSSLKGYRRRAQMVFQDPYASLNPRLRIGQSIEEPIKALTSASSQERQARVSALLEMVGLPETAAGKYPHAFSGGQRQRICIARALAVSPSFLVADEPLSALDVSVQAQVANVLRRLRDELGLTMLFIAHDLAVVRHLADRVIVLYLGRVMESGTRDQVFSSPRHPYTKALLSAVPIPDPVAERSRERVILSGDPPSPMSEAVGCVFSSRCPDVMDICRVQAPPLRRVDGDRQLSCHLESAASTPVAG